MKTHHFVLLVALSSSSAFAQPLISTITSDEGGQVRLINPQKTGATTNNWTIFNMTGPYNNGLAFWRYYADGTNVGTSVFFHDNGNVGIGTNTPDQRLTIKGGGIGFDHNSSDKKLYSPADGDLEWMTHDAASAHGFAVSHQGQKRVYLNTSGSSYFIGGNVGIGTTNPRSRLDIGSHIGAGQGASFGDYFEINERELINNAVSLGWNAHIAADNGTYAPTWAGAGASGMVLAMDGGGSSNLDFWGKQWTSGEPASLDSFTHVMRLSTNGNVGIGTTNPQHKLSVNGTIKAKEVIVETTGWSDYVFADNYRLTPLSEVEAHIAEKKHLPGMPSAAEVTENGVNVAQVQAALLAKVEELTLHLISQEKSLRELKAENETLKTRMATYECR